MIPTYVPIIAKKIARSKLNSNAGAAASISFSNLVPSSIVIPILYGSAAFHSNGILTRVVS